MSSLLSKLNLLTSIWAKFTEIVFVIVCSVYKNFRISIIENFQTKIGFPQNHLWSSKFPMCLQSASLFIDDLSLSTFIHLDADSICLFFGLIWLFFDLFFFFVLCSSIWIEFEILEFVITLCSKWSSHLFFKKMSFSSLCFFLIF